MHSSFQSQNIYILQKQPFYSGCLNSETLGDCNNAFQHCRDVSAVCKALHSTAVSNMTDLALALSISHSLFEKCSI